MSEAGRRTSSETSADEAGLVRAAQGGDSRAFAEIVTRYQRAIYRVAYGFTRVPADADDLVCFSKGESQFGAGLRKIGVVSECGIGLYIQGDAGASGSGHVPDDTYLTHLEAMPARKHSSTPIAV